MFPCMDIEPSARPLREQRFQVWLRESRMNAQPKSASVVYGATQCAKEPEFTAINLRSVPLITHNT